MKISKEQLVKIQELSERIKDLDPILKERIIDYELSSLLKDDYLQILSAKETYTHKEVIHKTQETTIPEASWPSKNKQTVKEFFDEKKPKIALETVAVFGFYMEHFKSQSEFSEADISKAFFDAKVRKPKVIGQALRDAKNVKGYLVEGSKKGTYRVSNIGENLVMHDLPRGDK